MNTSAATVSPRTIISWSRFFIKILLCVAPLTSYSYTVTRFDQSLCATSFPTLYVSGTFSIIENSVGEFGKNQSNKTLIFSLPSGFQFNTTVGTYAVVGLSLNDITSVSISAITATSLTVRVTTANVQLDINTITITCQIRAASVGSGIIFRNGGTFKINRSASNPTTAESLGNLSAEAVMAFASSTVAQVNTGSVPQGTVDNDIIQIQVVVTGTCSAFNLTQFSFSTNGGNSTGSTNAATDITMAKVYYTGATNSFAPTNLFGSVNSPNGVFIISGTQALSAGTHYFWLAYDVPSSATLSNLLDAQCTAIIMDGTIGAKVPTVQAPAGSRTISALAQFYSRATGNWNDNTNWSTTDGGVSCSCQPNGTGNVFINTGHTITVDANRIADFITIRSGATLKDNGVNTLTLNFNLNTLSTGKLTASSVWTVNGNLVLSGTGASTTTKTFTVNGNSTIENGASLTQNGTSGNDIVLKGHLALDGTISSGSAGGSIIMNGTSAQILSSTTGGIIAGSGPLTLSSSSKSIAVSSSVTIAPDVAISSSVSITNNGTVNATNVTGTVSGSTWVNAVNSTLNIIGTLLSTGTLTATAAGNTVNYNNAGDQTVKASTYSNLNLSQSGTKTFPGSTAVTNMLTISGSAVADAGTNTLNGAGGLTMTGSSELRLAKTTGSVPELTGVYSLTGGAISLNQSGAATQTPSAIAFYNLKLDGSNVSSNFDLSSVTDVLNNLEVTNKSNITANGILSVGGSFIHSTTGTTTLSNDLTANGSSTFSNGTFNVNGKYFTTGSLTLSSGTLTNSNGTIEITAAAGWAKDGGTYNISTGTVFFSGSTAQNIGGAQSTTFANLTIGNAAGVTINGGSGSVSRALTINTGSVFTISGTGDLSVGGNIINNGTFNTGTGTITLNGSTAQSLSGSTTTSFNNLSLTNTAGVSVESNQNMRGVLTLGSNVTFDADGAANTAVFKLLSTGDNPTQDASIAALPATAQITGNVTVQRFMGIQGINGGRIYRYVSAPVVNATVADIQNEITVTGSFTGSGIGSQSMFSYTESVVTDVNGSGTNDVNDGYADFPDASNTETFVPGKGYTIFVRGNLLATALWDLRGTVPNRNVTPVTFPVTFTSSGNISNDGWNLVGNPFPSTIDWNASSGWTKTNVEATIYMPYNGGTALEYATWNGVTGTNGGSRHIATGQGFWIKANASSPVLQASESIKTSGTQTIFFRQAGPENLLRVTMKKGAVRDEAVIHFREDATKDFDTHADARKLINRTFNLSTMLDDGRDLAINSMSALDCNSAIRLNILNTVPGDYRLEFSEFESFSSLIRITLHDKFANRSIDIRDGAYDFAVTSDMASYGSTRFSIIFNTDETVSDFVLNTVPTCEGEDASIQVGQSHKDITYTALYKDQVISTSYHGNGGTTNMTVSKDGLTTGMNEITVTSVIGNCRSERQVLLNVEKKYEVTSVNAAKVCGKGTVELMANGAPENGSFNWYETETSQVSIAGQHTSSFVTPVLNKTKTYYVSIVNALGCEGFRKPVIAEVVHVEGAQITTSGNRLVSNYQEGNQWYFNNEMTHETLQSITPGKSGTYRVDVVTNGCSTSAIYEFLAAEDDFKQIVVYPNPVKDIMHVQMPDSFQDDHTFEVINNSGQHVGTIELQSSQGKESGTLNMADLPSGVYFLQDSNAANAPDIRVIKD